MTSTFALSEDILRQAQAVGGDINQPTSIRQTSTSRDAPILLGGWSSNSKDGSYRGELNGKSRGDFSRR
jgi:hypothetical protein